jgi:Ca2+-binding RTX toxin-like protein
LQRNPHGTTAGPLLSGPGNETLNAAGSTANNLLVGGTDPTGATSLVGGSGNDTRFAGGGSDTLAGGAGNNAFAFPRPRRQVRTT